MSAVLSVQTRLWELADVSELEVFRRLNSSPKGLLEAQAAERLARYGENRPHCLTEAGAARRVIEALRSPFVGLLAALGVVFTGLGDGRGAVTVLVMVALSVAVRLWQQTAARRAMASLRTRVSATSTVRRRADVGYRATNREVPSQDVVPGDLLLLGPGDLIPADVRVLRGRDLTVDQSTLSGEALPVAKPVPTATPGRRERRMLVDSPTLCFAGTSVVAGTATSVVLATGSRTYVGSLAAPSPGNLRPESSFDKGVRAVGWTLARFMLVLAPLVLVVNATASGDWTRAVLFAVAVAVGLTPEMLPVIVTTNLARGAVRLAAEKVIVKRLNAIQDLGAADVLCVDKTGTLTEDRVAYAHSIDPDGHPDGQAAEYACLALHFQLAAPGRLDQAIIAELGGNPDEPDPDGLLTDALYEHVDEIGFDPYRRRATVVLRAAPDQHVLITKGDPDVVADRCTHQLALGALTELTPADRARMRDLVATHARHGMRILAVAVKHTAGRRGEYGEADESGLALVGFIGFVDPVGVGVAVAVHALDRHGVTVKVLTGDHERIAEHVCAQVGLRAGKIVLGHQLRRIDQAQLGTLVERTTVFARLSPEHKAQIVAALRANGHTVGFVGDGVNDAPALRLADVGIAANSATDVAKDAADLILLDKDLGVIAHGIVEGRRTMGNTLKYVHITASSNLGNVLSVVAASVFLPFLPMLPMQLLVQNLLYDAAQLALPWDRVDPDYLRRPRCWDAAGLTRFMLVFGPLSSVFDLATFAVLWRVFGAGADPSLFHTGWFVEGLCSQLLVVFVLRSALTSRRAGRAARPVVLVSASAALVGLGLGMSSLGSWLGMRPLPPRYLLWLAAVLLGYWCGAQLVKRWYTRMWIRGE